MSYVLDALKKSESERQQNQSQHLLSAHTAEPSFKKTHGFNRNYLFSALAFMLLLIFAASAMYRLMYLPKDDIRTQAAAETAETAETSNDGVRKSHIVINPKLQTIDTYISDYLRPNRSLVNLTMEKKKIRKTETIEPAPPAGPLPLLRDLPTEIRNKLPELNISGHTFSATPEKRMIIINNKILREGGVINGLTTLKEITWEGVIIDFNGVFFRVEN